MNFTKQDIINSHKTAKIKEYSKSKISYKDNSAHNLFMPQYMMGANDEFLLATTCFLLVTIVVILTLNLDFCVSKTNNCFYTFFFRY